MSKSPSTIIILACFLFFGSTSEAASINDTQNLNIPDNSGQTIPESIFREAYARFVCSSLNKNKDEIILSRFTVSGNMPLPAGKISLKLFTKGREEFVGYVRLVAIVSVDDIAKMEVMLSGWVDVFDSVVCTSHAINKGDIITDKDIYLERKNISRLNSEVFKDKDQVIGLMAKRGIKENDCLNERMLKKMPLVDKGDIVTIIAEHGSMKVTVPGRTLEKGYKDDYIRVQNAMSKKSFYAKVINDSTVVVDF